MTSNAQRSMAAANKMVTKTVNKLMHWQLHKAGSASENTGIPNQRRRATTNSAGGSASPS